MTEYKFNFTNKSDEFDEIFNIFMSEQAKLLDTYTLSDWVRAYKMALVNMSRYILSDIKGILEKQGITDVETQKRISDHFISHVNEHINEIVEPLLPQFGQYTLTNDDGLELGPGNTICVNFEKDVDIVFEHMANASAIALDRSKYEMAQIIEQQIEKDCKNLKTMSEDAPNWEKMENKEEYVARLAMKLDPQLLKKYGPIVFMFQKYFFNEVIFKESMQYFASNLSVPYGDIMLRYYQGAVRKDRHYKKNINRLGKFITKWEKSLAELEKNAEEIRNASEEGKKQLYSSWLTAPRTSVEPLTEVDTVPAESNINQSEENE